MAQDDIVIKIKANTLDVNSKLKKLESGIDSIGNKASQVAKASAIALGAIGIPLGIALNKAQEFELGLAGVQKVAGLSEQGLKKFTQGVMDLSNTIPATNK